MSKRPHRKPRKRPPATRLEGAERLGGLPESDINAIILAAAAGAEHGRLGDLLEAVCRMPMHVRAKIGELMLEIRNAEEAELERSLAASVHRAGRINVLVAAVEEGGEHRDLAHALVLTPEELDRHREARLAAGPDDLPRHLPRLARDRRP
jgi:hypothetical protein